MLWGLLGTSGGPTWDVKRASWDPRGNQTRSRVDFVVPGVSTLGVFGISSFVFSDIRGVPGTSWNPLGLQTWIIVDFVIRCLKNK